METTPQADRRLRPRGTPGSGRFRSALKTPQSVLTPNDDAAEKASIRRKRRSDALRLSLSDAFASQADRHKRQAQQQQQDQSSSKPTLSEEARNALLEQTLKLATENKITDRNAWHLDLITHLPDIIGSGPRGHTSSSSAGGYNFQKMSGGLDAGVTIYARRVELTYKSAMSLGQAPRQQGGDEEGYEDDGDEDADGPEGAAAAAAKAHKQKGGRARQGGSADEEATLTTPDHLRAKKGDQTFAVDPLFHTMSALFDEGGAKGLLLLNQSVYDGAHIMAAPHQVPEQAFPLQPPPQQDTLLHLHSLQHQLAACSTAAGPSQQAPAGDTSSAAASAAGAVLTPGLPKLYALLEETCRTMPGHKQQQQQGAGLDVASIMQEALRNLPPTPMPRLSSTTQTAAAAAAAAGGGGGVASSAAAGAVDPTAADPAAAAAAAAAGGGDVSMGGGGEGCNPSPAGFGDEPMQDGGLDDHMHDGDGGDLQCGGSSSSEGVTAAGGTAAGGLQVVASFLATCEATAAEGDDAAGGEGDFGDGGQEYGGYDDDGGGWGQQQQDRRQSLLGLGGEQEPDSCSGLDADALQQLLGVAAGGGSSSSRAGGTTAGSGWAGSRFWKYRSAAAAAARMAAGSSGGAVKRAAAVSGGSRSRSAQARLDFCTRPSPAELAPKLARGDRKQTCLATAARAGADKTKGRAGSSNSNAADTLLPEDLHYQPSSLLQLFLRPDAVGSARQQHYQQQQGHGGSRGAGGCEAGDGQLPSWAEEGPGGGEGEDGYYDDGDGGFGSAGAEGYNAGDLSVGDPGFSTAGGGGRGDEWWSPDGELLSAPKRVAGRGVSYQRSAKQVDVRALKDLLWDSLLTVNQQKAAADTQHTDPGASPPTASAAAAGALPVVPFEEVIVHVPEDSAAGALEDVSVHMCFICLLHLANEKGLVVKAHDDLKTLTISNVN